MNILLADDHPVTGRLVSLFIEHMHHTVELVGDGTTALARMSAEQAPPMAILAWSLPELPGPEVARRLRAADVPQRFLVLMTANDDPDLERKVLDCGADAYLLKPVTQNQIEALIRQAEAARASDLVAA